MPKRIGGDWLGNHKRLYKIYQVHHTRWKLYMLLTTLFVGQYLPSTSLLVYTRGLLILLLFFGMSPNIYTFCTFLLHCCLDHAPPPWAQAKNVYHITQRHFRKHGGYKIVPRYTLLRLTNIAMLLQALLSPSNTHVLDSRLETNYVTYLGQHQQLLLRSRSNTVT